MDSLRTPRQRRNAITRLPSPKKEWPTLPTPPSPPKTPRTPPSSPASSPKKGRTLIVIGSKGGAAGRSKVSYQSAIRTVRLDTKQRKYIILNNKKIYLQTIRGQYQYV